MPNVEIYTKNWCPYCRRARDLLDARGVDYHELDVTTDSLLESEMIKRSTRITVPQIFIDGHHVGGSDDLAAAEESGVLDQLLAPRNKRDAA